MYSNAIRRLRTALPFPLVLALMTGTALRIAAMMAAYPAVYHSRDMIRYTLIWPKQLFADWWMPAGYPFILKVLRMVTPQVALVTVLQHAAGLVIGLCGYALARRVGAPRWIAVAAAVPALVSGDLLFIEHSLSTETFFTLFMAAAFVTAAIAFTRQSLPPLVAASCLLAAATLMRNIGQLLVVAIALGVMVAWWGSPRAMVKALVLATLPAVLILRGYFALATAGGGYAGLSDMGGWNLYGRTSTFADCAQFEPPPGSEVLCESRPASERPGTFFYGSSPHSPAKIHFTLPNATYDLFALDRSKNALVREFALRAITHQPLEYARTVARDAGRYFMPSLDQRGWAGPGPEWYDFRSVHRWESEAWLTSVIAEHYVDATIHWRPRVVAAIGAYAAIVRFHGVVLFVVLTFALAGLVLTRTRTILAVLVMLISGALALYLLPVVMATFDWRYGFPAQVPISWAAALGLWVAITRWRRAGADPSTVRSEVTQQHD